MSERASARAAIYVRISNDKTGLEAGVERQEADCRKFCEQRGYEVAAVYSDNDVSASEYGKKVRSGYKQMLKAIELGEVQAVVAYHLDRLIRQPRELEALIPYAEKATIHTLFGDINLATGDGRAMARVGAAFAALESDNKSRRLKDAVRHNAAKGKPHGGIRPYGYDSSGLNIVPEEAEVIVEAAERVLSGEGLNAIVRDFNERGIKPVKAAKFNTQSLRQMLCSPRLAGLSVHAGAVVGEGQWSPILTVEQHEALTVHFEASSQKFKHVPKARTHLLSGLVTCHNCGQPMAAKVKSSGVVYLCYARANNPDACGKCSIKAEPVDAYVYETLIAYLTDDETLAEALNGSKGEEAADAAALVADLQKRLEVLQHDHYVEGLVPAAAFKALSAELTARIDDARNALLATASNRTLATVATTEEALRKQWTSSSLDWRRAVIQAVFSSIVIQAGKPANQYSTEDVFFDRVELSYR